MLCLLGAAGWGVMLLHIVSTGLKGGLCHQMGAEMGFHPLAASHFPLLSSHGRQNQG